MRPDLSDLRQPSLCLLLLWLIVIADGREECAGHNFDKVVGGAGEEYIIYGLTQDCQIFFARSSQIALISSIPADTRNNYCFPNLVQLQLISNTTLRLLIKQPGNRICVLNINLPPIDILFGPQLFSYPLASSLPYAACSHSTGPFSLEADLAFPDSAFSDVLYFVDPTSSGARWTVRQFLLQETNHFRLLDKMTVPSRVHESTDIANEFVLALDTDRNYLYKRNRFHPQYRYECAFDLLFRPRSAVSHSGSVISDSSLEESRRWLNSMAVDKQLMLFAETDKQSPVAPTQVYAQNVSHGQALCIARLPFRVEIGVVSLRTLAHLARHALPKFDVARQQPHRPYHPRAHHTSSHATTSSSSAFPTLLTTVMPAPVTAGTTTTTTHRSRTPTPRTEHHHKTTTQRKPTGASMTTVFSSTSAATRTTSSTAAPKYGNSEVYARSTSVPPSTRRDSASEHRASTLREMEEQGETDGMASEEDDERDVYQSPDQVEQDYASPTVGAEDSGEELNTDQSTMSSGKDGDDLSTAGNSSSSSFSNGNATSENSKSPDADSKITSSLASAVVVFILAIR